MEPHRLEKTALVLAGPQGCGKTRLANYVASQFGRTLNVDADQLNTDRERADLLAQNAAAWVVDGLPGRMAQPFIKLLITQDTVRTHPTNRPPVPLRSPRLIFCTSGDANALSEVEGNRRFFVVHMGKQPATA